VLECVDSPHFLFDPISCSTPFPVPAKPKMLKTIIMNESKILVIEDTESIRNELRDIFVFEGMHVITAKNGQEGIDKAKEYLPDLILCDIMMPIKNGYEVFDEMKMNSDLMFIPFLFITAKATVENIREGMIMGADDYITKPFNVDLLIKSIESRLLKEVKRKQSEKGRIETLQYNISSAIPHELLTPLNGILGLSSLIKDPNFEVDETEARDLASGIFDSGNRLLNTLKKFITYTEIELLINNKESATLLNQKITCMSEHELSEQMRVIARIFNRESDLDLNLKSFKAKISAYHFKIIMENIADNAFKFSRDMDKVKVVVELEDSHVDITITDNGLGFNDVTLKEIGAFTQFKRSRMEQQGLGLGLITSQKLVDFYNGKLNISKNSPRGSCVRISLLLVK
jgi:two-component system sensor histidine kinase/response regulator